MAHKFHVTEQNAWPWGKQQQKNIIRRKFNLKSVLWGQKEVEYHWWEPGDHAQRMDLCNWIKAHPKLLSVILFSDEASCTRDGVINSRNVHTRYHDNAHETSVTNFQMRFTVNVWCGVLGNKLIGTFVFDNNLTGNAYGVFLRNELPGLLEDIPLMIRSQMYFQHDGSPPHYI